MLCWAKLAVRTLIVPPSAPALLSVMLADPLIRPEGPVRMLRGLTELVWRLTKPEFLIWPSMRMSPPLPPNPYWKNGLVLGGTPAPVKISTDRPETPSMLAPAITWKLPLATRPKRGAVKLFSMRTSLSAARMLG